jgi:hypothetical protein
MSDWERYLNSESKVFTPTGLINVYACDNNGESLSDGVKQELLTRIEPYKDVGMLEIANFNPIEHVLEFSFYSASNIELFKQFVQSQASLFYSIPYLQSHNISIFKDLDLAALLQNILNTSPYSSIGLAVKGYHYYEIAVGKSVEIGTYDGEEPGDGKYELITDQVDASGNFITYKFEEQPPLPGSEFSEIIDVSNYTKIGERYQNRVVMSFNSYTFVDATLKCYWGMKDKALLTVGSDNGIRKLHSIMVKSSSE